MKISFSTNAFTRYNVLEAVEYIGRAGYSGVEILADAPHCFADTTTQLDLEQISKILNRYNLKAVNINANTAMGFYGVRFWEPLFEPSLAHPDNELRQWRLSYSKKCVDMASFLKCPNISITSGRFVPGTSPSKSTELLIKSTRELVEYGQSHGVRIGMEYEPGLIVESGHELKQLIELINSDYFGANLDLGHSHVLGEDPAETLRSLMPYVFHIHLEDISNRKHYHLIPGEGDIDFVELFKLLIDSGYNGYTTIELYTYADNPEYAASASISYIQRVLDLVSKE